MHGLRPDTDVDKCKMDLNLQYGLFTHYMSPPLLQVPDYFWSEIYQANISRMLNDIISSLKAKNPTLQFCLQTCCTEHIQMLSMDS